MRCKIPWIPLFQEHSFLGKLISMYLRGLFFLTPGDQAAPDRPILKFMSISSGLQPLWDDMENNPLVSHPNLAQAPSSWTAHLPDTFCPDRSISSVPLWTCLSSPRQGVSLGLFGVFESMGEQVVLNSTLTLKLNTLGFYSKLCQVIAVFSQANSLPSLILSFLFYKTDTNRKISHSPLVLIIETMC